ncbi:hypothetical protein [Streptomyces fradiae]|uniref:hypothetical protein n=1 Tax=Streptomyces fradiae TaxID=1906 RepID=UPI003987CBF1
MLLGVAAGVGWISGGWTLLAVVQLIGASAFYTAGQNPVPGQHRQLRHAAAALGVASVTVPMLAFGVLPWWVWLLPHVPGPPSGEGRVAHSHTDSVVPCAGPYLTAASAGALRGRPLRAQGHTLRDLAV